MNDELPPLPVLPPLTDKAEAEAEVDTPWQIPVRIAADDGPAEDDDENPRWRITFGSVHVALRQPHLTAVTIIAGARQEIIDMLAEDAKDGYDDELLDESAQRVRDAIRDSWIVIVGANRLVDIDLRPSSSSYQDIIEDLNVQLPLPARLVVDADVDWGEVNKAKTARTFLHEALDGLQAKLAAYGIPGALIFDASVPGRVATCITPNDAFAVETFHPDEATVAAILDVREMLDDDHAGMMGVVLQAFAWGVQLRTPHASPMVDQRQHAQLRKLGLPPVVTPLGDYQISPMEKADSIVVDPSQDHRNALPFLGEIWDAFRVGMRSTGPHILVVPAPQHVWQPFVHVDVRVDACSVDALRERSGFDDIDYDAIILNHRGLQQLSEIDRAHVRLLTRGWVSQDAPGSFRRHIVTWTLTLDRLVRDLTHSIPVDPANPPPRPAEDTLSASPPPLPRPRTPTPLPVVSGSIPVAPPPAPDEVEVPHDDFALALVRLRKAHRETIDTLAQLTEIPAERLAQLEAGADLPSQAEHETLIGWMPRLAIAQTVYAEDMPAEDVAAPELDEVIAQIRLGTRGVIFGGDKRIYAAAWPEYAFDRITAFDNDRIKSALRSIRAQRPDWVIAVTQFMGHGAWYQLRDACKAAGVPCLTWNYAITRLLKGFIAIAGPAPEAALAPPAPSATPDPAPGSEAPAPADPAEDTEVDSTSRGNFSNAVELVKLDTERVALDAPTPMTAAVRQLREAGGLSRAELGELVGVTEQAVWAWEEAGVYPVRLHFDRLTVLWPQLTRLDAAEHVRDIAPPLGRSPGIQGPTTLTPDDTASDTTAEENSQVPETARDFSTDAAPPARAEPAGDPAGDTDADADADPRIECPTCGAVYYESPPALIESGICPACDDAGLVRVVHVIAHERRLPLVRRPPEDVEAEPPELDELALAAIAHAQALVAQRQAEARVPEIEAALAQLEITCADVRSAVHDPTVQAAAMRGMAETRRQLCDALRGAEAVYQAAERNVEDLGTQLAEVVERAAILDK